MHDMRSSFTQVPALLAGLMAALASGAVAAEPVTIQLAPTQSQLMMIEGRDAARSLTDSRLKAVDADGAAERALVAYCANGEAQRTAADKGLVGEFLSQILSVTLEKVSDRIHAEMAKYSAVSEGSTRVDYYRGIPGTPGPGRLESRYQCLRFVRIADSPGGAEVALDIVAGIGLDTAKDAIALRPLRLYVNKAAARSATGKYGVAISIHADSVWRDASVGHQATVFEQTIATESIDLNAGPFLKYYPVDVMGGRRVPIVPISSDIDRTRDFGRVDLTVSAAEIGTPPGTLNLLSQLFPLTTERRARLLIEAAIISNLPMP
jgi:hypothetical protein